VSGATEIREAAGGAPLPGQGLRLAGAGSPVPRNAITGQVSGGPGTHRYVSAARSSERMAGSTICRNFLPELRVSVEHREVGRAELAQVGQQARAERPRHGQEVAGRAARVRQADQARAGSYGADDRSRQEQR
jgi:hypothetical protein